MAKITKQMLKGVVKECLIEILSEGIGDTSLNENRSSIPSRRNITVESTKNRNSQNSTVIAPKKKTIFDQMDMSFKQKTGDNIDHYSKIATADPLLQSILADTAKTTLQEQLAHEQSTPRIFHDRDMSENIVQQQQHTQAAGLDIDAIFGDVSANWKEVLDRTEKK